MGIHPLIRYLCKHKDRDPKYLPLAERLNRWVEDQFVTFGPGDEASGIRVKGPLVFEQYACWAPMEGHTANWIDSLIELHRASGKGVYLDKAKAAANAICHEQFPDGEFSTWGRDYQTGESATISKPKEYQNWYNANAAADSGLYKLVLYVKSLGGKK